MKRCHRFETKVMVRTLVGLAVLLVVSVPAFPTALEQSPATARIPQNFNTLPGPEAAVFMPSELIDGDPSAVRMQFFDPPIEYGSVTLDGIEYGTIRMPGEGSIYLIGEPDLPAVHRLLMIDPTGDVSVSILSQSYHIESGPIPAPCQSLDPEANLDGGVEISSDVYSSNEWYPAQPAFITTPANFRDIRFVVLTICPVQVNPVTGERRIFDNIEVMVENIGGLGANEVYHTPQTISPSFKRMYQQFENFAGSPLDALPVLPGQYMIICQNQATMTAATDTLMLWKKRKGLNVVRVYTDGTPSATEVRTLINNQWTSSGFTLEHVCLFGDPDGTAGSTYIPTEGTQLDNYYGTLNSGGGPNPDPVPDISVGRLSGITTTAHLSMIVNKTLNYEFRPTVSPDNAWFSRAWCAAHTGSCPGSSCIASNPSTKRYTEQLMLLNGVNTVFFNTYTSDFPQADAVTRLTTGISVFNHRQSWISQVSTSDQNGLPTNGKYPFVMTISCGTGSFASGYSVSESWLRPSDISYESLRGAIGAIGLHGAGTHVPYNNIVDAGVMYGLYGLDVHEQGLMCIQGKLELYRNYQTFRPTSVQEFCYWANLMGDPATPVWTTTPKTINIDGPALTLGTIPLGTNNVSLTVTDQVSGVPREGALVCLLKGSVSSPETFARGYTDEDGFINLPVSTPTAGYMYVTISKEDIYTKFDSIQVLAAGQSLAYSSMSLDDDNSGGTVGDNNDSLNAGETIDLNITLTNPDDAGNLSVTGISGTLTSTSPGITVTQAVSAYPNIADGGTGTNTTPFRFTATAMFDREPVQFFLNLTTGAGNFVVRLDLTPYTGNVQYVNVGYSGPGGTPDPGETGNYNVTFRNNGWRSLISASGILRSLDPFVIVNDSTGTFGTVTPNNTATNSVDQFNITLSNQSYNGHRADLLLIVTDANGIRDSVAFRDTVGVQTSTSPTGPDEFGYYAYDNTETQPAGTASSYSWIEIAPSQGGPGTSLGFLDDVEDADDYVTLALPFDFMFYGQNFTQITVCSNGWLAFGSYQMWDFRNYRMGTPLGPPYMVAAYWDDLWISGASNNVYYYYDAANHWYIVEWRAQTQFSSPQVNEFFEIIIYDPDFYPSASGNGKVKVQYNTVNLNANNENPNDNDYASFGIQNGDHSIGLDYGYWNTWSPGSAAAAAGRSIMYTTDATGQLSPIITVNTPNGGESWYVGQAYNILWNSSSVSGNVNVEINRTYPSASWTSLFSNTANDGIQSWTVTAPASTTARIRVTSVSAPSVSDTSNANFSLINPTITVLNPNGGEAWLIGQQVEIAYNSVGAGAATVSLNRSYPGGAWEVIDANAGGSASWIVTAPGSNNCRVRVISNSVPSAGDTSDANFTIGQYPAIVHDNHADAAPGAVTFTSLVTDELPGFAVELNYRIVGAGVYTTQAMTATGNPDEYSCATVSLAAGEYEYYVRVQDTQGLITVAPSSGNYYFDVNQTDAGEIAYDDGVAENYNWVDGTGFKWAVKFDAASYPYYLCDARFAICPTCPQSGHQAVLVWVYLADGPGGLPGTEVFRDTTGSAGNTVGGLPSGAAWTDCITRSGGNCLTLNQAFYIAVQNMDPRDKPAAFATDTSVTRTGRSYFWDECDMEWFSETTSGHENARPGDRMIRARGFEFAPPEITVRRMGNDAQLNWAATGAPYYRVYAATTSNGVYSYIGTSSTNSYLDTNTIPTNVNRFYQVTSSDVP